MGNSAPRHKGKRKWEIAAEAFQILGPEATIAQVDTYFQTHYHLPHCERSMYLQAKRAARGRPAPKRLRNKQTVADLVRRTVSLAQEVGGWDELLLLIDVLRTKKVWHL